MVSVGILHSTDRTEMTMLARILLAALRHRFISGCVLVALVIASASVWTEAQEAPDPVDSQSSSDPAGQTDSEQTDRDSTGGIAGSPAEGDQVEPDDYELMKMFVDAVDEVQRNYVEPISRRELMEAAIEGVLSKLDTYSDYIAPEDVDDFQKDVDAEFGGIGIHVEMRSGALTVISPLRGSPGESSGLRPDDVILEIDGFPATDKPLDDSIKRMKGRLGTDVVLKVRHRDGTEQTLTVTRAKIQVETVVSHSRNADGSWDWTIDDQFKIGYVRIISFSGHTPKELEAALKELQADGMRGLILDLRFNPGGLLPAAIEVADLLLSKGRIVSTSGRNADSRTWDAKKAGTYEGFPLVVLVNHFSASASEIVSACLQDNHRATVIGTRTWGKGSVQKVIELPGRSAMKLTTSSYLRPNGKNIHRAKNATEDDEWGVQPDQGMEVKLSRDQMRRVLEFHRDSFRLPGSNQPTRSVYIDPQLSRAIEKVKTEIR